MSEPLTRRLRRASVRRLRKWAARRHGADSLPLTVNRRRIYILPTRFGLALAALLAAMLIAALNYNSNLALAFAFFMVSLALVADAWSRTYRSSALTFARSADAVQTLNGLRILPDQVEPDKSGHESLRPIGNRKPVVALDDALRTISDRYGARTADFVAMQLEYPARSPP